MSKMFKEFDRKSNYTRHINKKNKCKEISSKVTNIKKNESNRTEIGAHAPKAVQDDKMSNICEFCNQSFTRRSSLNRHYTRCKIKKLHEENELKEKMFKLLLNKMEKQEENYGKQIKILQDKIENLSTGTITYNYNTNNTNNNTNNNTSNNTVNSMINNVNTINVLAYNKTDISHLKDKDYKKVLRREIFVYRIW